MKDLRTLGSTGGGQVAELEQEVADLRERLRQVPGVFSPSSEAQPKLALQIIGGNTVSGIDCIKYASTVTPAAVYDPDVDTAYPDGIGRGWLWSNGVRSRRVLILHGFAGFPYPVQAGRIFRASGTESISYDPGTGPVSMACYLFDLG